MNGPLNNEVNKTQFLMELKHPNQKVEAQL